MMANVSSGGIDETGQRIDEDASFCEISLRFATFK
jgi:hypothetical protein